MSGRRRRRRQHLQAVGRLDDHLAGHRARPTRISLGAVDLRRHRRKLLGRPAGTATLSVDGSIGASPTSRSSCSAKIPTPNSSATARRSNSARPTRSRSSAEEAQGRGHSDRRRSSSPGGRCGSTRVNASDAFVAAFLPGSEGGGIADVLFRGPDGAASATTSRGMMSSVGPACGPGPLMAATSNYDPLFAYGYGLSQNDLSEVPQLSEERPEGGAAGADGVFFARGALPTVWTFSIGRRNHSPDRSARRLGRTRALLTFTGTGERLSAHGLTSDNLRAIECGAESAGRISVQAVRQMWSMLGWRGCVGARHSGTSRSAGRISGRRSTFRCAASRAAGADMAKTRREPGAENLGPVDDCRLPTYRLASARFNRIAAASEVIIKAAKVNSI